MTLLKIYYVRCDGCGRIIGRKYEAAAARRDARKAGWKRRPGSTKIGRDFCPPCAVGKDGVR